MAQPLLRRGEQPGGAARQDESEEPAQPVTGSCTLLDVQTPEQAQQLLSGVTLSIAAADDLSMLVAAPLLWAGLLVLAGAGFVLLRHRKHA